MTTKKLIVEVQKEVLAICKLNRSESIPSWAMSGSFFSISHTTDELSIVCHDELVPADIKTERDWRSLKVQGALSFSEVGILAQLSNVLAKVGVSIFVISTFDTDYIQVNCIALENAIKALSNAGIDITYAS